MFTFYSAANYDTTALQLATCKEIQRVRSNFTIWFSNVVVKTENVIISPCSFAKDYTELFLKTSARVPRLSFIIRPITFSAYLVTFVVVVHDATAPLIIIIIKPLNHQPVIMRVSFTVASVKTLYQNISSDTWRWNWVTTIPAHVHLPIFTSSVEWAVITLS